MARTAAARAEPLRTFGVRGLSYRYPGAERGIADVDLDMRRGDFVVVTGEVGAGKTTLLRCLLGLLPRRRRRAALERRG